MAFPPSKAGRMPFFTPISSAPVNNRFTLQVIPPSSAKSSQKVDGEKNSHSDTTNVPTTTVFVGNIAENCSNDLIQNILKLCGSINNWKRLQDTNSKYKAFGFCDFAHPEGTLRALRILNNFQLGDKKLTVKTDDATSKMLRDFQAKQQEAEQKEKADECRENGELPTSQSDADVKIIQQILVAIKEDNPKLLEEADESVKNNNEKNGDDGLRRNASRSSNRSPHSRSCSRANDVESSKKSHKSSRKRSRSSSRRRHRSQSSHSRRVDSSSRNKRSKSRTADVSPKRKSRRRKHTRESSASRSPSSSSRNSSSSSHGGRGRRGSGADGRRRRDRRSRSHSHSPADGDSDDAHERHRLKMEIKRKEQSYLKRLAKWEDRERRMAKQYEKDEDDEVERKKMIQREAKKLRQFLEDYDDERDDPKYYNSRSSSLFQRRRNYERERESDVKDRQEELHEIEELKKQILAENKNIEDAEAEARKRHEAKGKEKLKFIRSHSGSPTPHRPLGQPVNGGASLQKSEHSSSAEDDDGMDVADDDESSTHSRKNNNEEEDNTNLENVSLPMGASASSISIPTASTSASEATASGSGAKLTINKPVIGRMNGIFVDDDEDEDQQAKRKIKPFEITREDRIQSMTPEERKKLIKELIERIPTAKDQLFAFAISWEYVNETLVEKRVKPWINKKICEYIGDEEPSLVAFICEKIAVRGEPKKILADLAMVLDDEAEVFMIKLWRLIIYESEAKKLGLNVFPTAGTTNSSGGDSAGRT